MEENQRGGGEEEQVEGERPTVWEEPAAGADEGAVTLVQILHHH